MTQYIDKSALVAEIKRLYNRAERRASLEKEGLKAEDTRKYEDGLADAYDIIISFIDTLEVKEMDFEKELESWRHNHFHGRRDKEASGEYFERITQLELAKHFFELGLKTNTKKDEE